jgi:gliding motility associated protien GldN
MKEKMNQVFYYPETPDQGRKNLITVLMEGIRETGNITAYNPDVDDMFTQPMTVEQVMKEKMTRVTVVDKFNEETMEMEQVEVLDTLKNYDITRFEIKEEVFFDKQRSVLETRILGICPLVEEFRNGEFIGYRKLFWVYFPEARAVLAQNEVYNRHNDVHRLTFDDVFWKRMFSSTVTKESNVYNRKISQYKAPLDAVLEAEKIEEEIFHLEHDLWSF